MAESASVQRVNFADFGHGAGASTLGFSLAGLDVVAASDSRLDADLLFRSNTSANIASADASLVSGLVDVAVVSSASADWRQVMRCRPLVIVSLVPPPHVARAVFSFAKFSVNSSLFGSPLAKMQTVHLGLRGEGSATTSLLRQMVARVEAFSLRRKKVVKDLFPALTHFYMERDGSSKRVYSANFPCPSFSVRSHRRPLDNFKVADTDSSSLEKAHCFSMEELGLIAGFPPYYKWDVVDADAAMRLLSESVTVPVAYALGSVVRESILNGELRSVVSGRVEPAMSEMRVYQETLRRENRRRGTPRLTVLASLGALVERFAIGRRQATYVYGTSPSLDSVVSGFLPGLQLRPGWIVLVRERSAGQGEDTFWRESATSTRLLRTRDQVARALAIQRFEESPAGKCMGF